MMAQQKISVEIFGQNLHLKSAADQEYTAQLAAYVDEQIRKVSRQSNDPIKVVLLASMNIANELFEIRKERDDSAEQIEHRTDSILAMLKKAV